MKNQKAMERIEEARAEALAALPERLQRLNRELGVERIKDYDTVYAVRGEHRFKIAVFRHGSGGFVATTKAAGHVHRYNGATPVDAYVRLTDSLGWLTARLDFEKNQTLRQLGEVSI